MRKACKAKQQDHLLNLFAPICICYRYKKGQLVELAFLLKRDALQKHQIIPVDENLFVYVAEQVLDFGTGVTGDAA